MKDSMKPESVLRMLPKLDPKSDYASKLTLNIILKHIIIKIVKSLGSEDTIREESKNWTPTIEAVVFSNEVLRWLDDQT